MVVVDEEQYSLSEDLELLDQPSFGLDENFEDFYSLLDDASNAKNSELSNRIYTHRKFKHFIFIFNRSSRLHERG